jgi:hypothetical protein
MESIEQTATEWLMPNILGLTLQLQNNRISQRTCELKILELFEQAKAMEKEQIVNAVDGFPLNNRNLEGEQYYNETYGGNK